MRYKYAPTISAPSVTACVMYMLTWVVQSSGETRAASCSSPINCPKSLAGLPWLVSEHKIRCSRGYWHWFRRIVLQRMECNHRWCCFLASTATIRYNFWQKRLGIYQSVLHLFILYLYLILLSVYKFFGYIISFYLCIHLQPRLSAGDTQIHLPEQRLRSWHFLADI